MSPEQVLKNTDFSQFDIYQGDCVNIAVALKRVFGGTYVASYANEVDFHDGRPAHFATRIGGTLYDGGGKTSRGALQERAYYGGGADEWDSIVVTEVPNPDRQLLDPQRVSQIRQELESVL